MSGNCRKHEASLQRWRDPQARFIRYHFIMADPIITLTTDFGEASPYVAAMKGVIVSINPAARIIDLSHQVPPQDVRHADHFLAAAIPYFPEDVIHVVVIDPGVGTSRHALYVDVAGHRLLLPDNGCWTTLARQFTEQPAVRRLAEPRFWRQPLSSTFHGRDIFAPTAAHLSLAVDPALLGPEVTEWVRLDLPEPRLDVSSHTLVGEVVFVDAFGNLITNIPESMLARWPDRYLGFRVGDHVTMRYVRTYGEAQAGQLVALIGSSGMLELALVNGNAAQELPGSVGMIVRVAIGYDPRT
jgi:S-adenosylmethionine hydrolase